MTGKDEILEKARELRKAWECGAGCLHPWLHTAAIVASLDNLATQVKALAETLGPQAGARNGRGAWAIPIADVASVSGLGEARGKANQ